MAEAELSVDFADGEHPLWRGLEAGLAEALAAAARAEGVSGLVAVLLGDDDAVAALNAQWRSRPGPTNVLSFPAPEGAPAADVRFLGDIALAAQTIAKEADSQGKSFEAHAAHLIVHGFLHLLGYDHGEASAAAAMEARERDVLAQLGIADPYA